MKSDKHVTAERIKPPVIPAPTVTALACPLFASQSRRQAFTRFSFRLTRGSTPQVRSQPPGPQLLPQRLRPHPLERSPRGARSCWPLLFWLFSNSSRRRGNAFPLGSRALCLSPGVSALGFLGALEWFPRSIAAGAVKNPISLLGDPTSRHPGAGNRGLLCCFLPDDKRPVITRHLITAWRTGRLALETGVRRHFMFS